MGLPFVVAQGQGQLFSVETDNDIVDAKAYTVDLENGNAVLNPQYIPSNGNNIIPANTPLKYF